MSKRLDQSCIEYFSTRAKAQDAIKAGRVKVNKKTITKCSYLVNEEDEIEIEKKEVEFVSRAYEKLDTALKTFLIDLKDKVVLDIGASTGGFTQACLQAKARKVYALDVGHLQLDPILDQDQRVVKMEGCNAREIEADWFDEPIDFICMDVSFISAKTILDHVFSVLDVEKLVVLVKPQFECGPQALNKKGVLKNPNIRKKILEDMDQYFRQFYERVDWIDSPIKGRSGNLEALAYLHRKRPNL